MTIQMKIIFCVKRAERVLVDSLLQRLGVSPLPLTTSHRFAPQTDPIDYEVVLTYNPDLLESIRLHLADLGIVKIACSYQFHYDNQDYDHSPYFILQGTGNSSDAYVDDLGSEYELEIICSNCKLHRKKLASRLVIDTSLLGDQFMVHVDQEHLVISEKMASLLKEWNMNGYALQPVVHKGDEKDQQPAFHLIPTDWLPRWSSENPRLDLIGARKCSVCEKRGILEYPMYYDSSSLAQVHLDFAYTHEEVVAANRLIRLPMISAHLRRKLIEFGITDDVRTNEQYGERDWLLEPIVLLNK